MEKNDIIFNADDLREAFFPFMTEEGKAVFNNVYNRKVAEVAAAQAAAEEEARRGEKELDEMFAACFKRSKI